MRFDLDRHRLPPGPQRPPGPRPRPHGAFCKTCGGTDHYAKTCKPKRAHRPTCTACDERGHYRKNCPMTNPVYPCKQVRWQQARRASGLCVTCGKPRVSAFYCRRHADAQNARHRKGPPRNCRTCGEPGHYTKTCPKAPRTAP